ncbi:MAG: gamma carbonic anhydrase family protein [Methylotenera sp.]|uniref:gamma carbonic anhydrase family protein n=1 Tax=Methylotenera sp. TaxID=2051956 RepID=UPI0018570AC9|nr:gamma carbonic anhydrase family protein [Methylotenera sp.]NOU24064.1 gamma carbonic anhydrase family protein [Methylotenera sp.]
MARLKNIQNFQNKAPQLAPSTYVHESAIVIGEVSIGENSSVWPGAVIRGDVNFIRIGKNTNIQDLSILHVNHKSSEDPEGSPLIIGDYVTIGHTVILHGCTIEDECLIGMGSIVMDKAIVQKQVLLAAGSLVPEGKILESGNLYVGRPAKKVRALTLEEIKHLKYSADNYVKLKNEY